MAPPPLSDYVDPYEGPVDWNEPAPAPCPHKCSCTSDQECPHECPCADGEPLIPLGPHEDPFPQRWPPR